MAPLIVCYKKCKLPPPFPSSPRVLAADDSKFSVRSVARNTTLTQRNSALLCRPLPRSIINPILRNGASLRFASTIPISSPPPINGATAASSASPPSEFVENALAATETSILDMPECIGYLKSLGLDYGWGPTAVVEWLLEHIHVFAGTPWWGSIVLCAVAVRVISFWPAVISADVGARLTIIKPLLEPLKARQADTTLDSAARTQALQEMRELSSKAGIRTWKTIMPLTTAVLGFGSWRLLRGMSDIPVPGFENGGLLWFQDLAVRDPTFILPLSTAAVLYMVLKKGGETGTSTFSPETQRNMTYGLPALTLAFTSFLPASLTLSFLTAGICSAIQGRLLVSPTMREILGIHPLPKPVEAAKVDVPKIRMAPTSQDIVHQMPTPRKSPNFLLKPIQDIGGKAVATYNEAKKALESTAESGRNMAGMSKEKVAERMKKADKAEAERYERERQKQLKQQAKQRRRRR